MEQRATLMQLDAGSLALLKLAAREVDEKGWAKVSKLVWPLAAALPDDLVLKHSNDDGTGKVRLTDGGRAIVAYA